MTLSAPGFRDKVYAVNLSNNGSFHLSHLDNTSSQTLYTVCIDTQICGVLVCRLLVPGLFFIRTFSENGWSKIWKKKNAWEDFVYIEPSIQKGVGSKQGEVLHVSAICFLLKLVALWWIVLDVAWCVEDDSCLMGNDELLDNSQVLIFTEILFPRCPCWDLIDLSLSETPSLLAFSRKLVYNCVYKYIDR